MKVLECSSIGDERFSSLKAKVSVFGVEDTIVAHLECSKLFRVSKAFQQSNEPETFQYKDWNKVKTRGLKPVGFKVGKQEFQLKYLKAWFKLLWVKYLRQHPELVEYAKGFDDFQNNCEEEKEYLQVNVIRKYVTKGEASILNEKLVSEFSNMLKKQNYRKN